MQNMKMTRAMRATILGLLTTGKTEHEIAAIIGISIEDLENLYTNDPEWKNAFEVINPYQLLGECMMKTQEILAGEMFRTTTTSEERKVVLRDGNGSPDLTPDGKVQYIPSSLIVKTVTEQVAPRMPDIISLAGDLHKSIKTIENKKAAPLIEAGKWAAIEDELNSGEV
jgi:hypothetical protein